MFSKNVDKTKGRRTLGTALAMGGVAGLLVAASALTIACSAAEDGTGIPEAEAADVSSEAAAIDPAVDLPPLPSPFAFARALDLECRPSMGAPPVDELGIRQLNPVLKDVLPNQQIKLHEMLHTCLPVSKNGVTPPLEILRFIRWVDLACYRAEADPVDVKVNLSHLNPVLAGLPESNVRLTELKRFCSPVRKNFSEIPFAVRRLIEHMDFACYQFEEATDPADINLVLSHLNPVVQAFGFPNRIVHLERSHQLCVPVAKNQQPVPEDVKHVVEWVDLQSFALDLIAGPQPVFPLTLTQLNPLFAGTPPTFTNLFPSDRLMVPVAKNHVLPPID